MSSHQLKKARRIKPCLEACLISLLLAANGALAAPRQSEETPGAEPAAAPAFRLEALDGRLVSAADFPDKVVLLDFWATWCIPCRAQAATLESVFGEYTTRGVQFLAIDMEEERSAVQRFVTDKPFPYPVLLDPAGQASASFGVFALPHLAVIDRRGRVTYSESGLVAEDLVRRLLDEAGAHPKSSSDPERNEGMEPQ